MNLTIFSLVNKHFFSSFSRRNTSTLNLPTFHAKLLGLLFFSYYGILEATLLHILNLLFSYLILIARDISFSQLLLAV